MFSDTQPSKNTDGASILLFFNIAGKVLIIDSLSVIFLANNIPFVNTYLIFQFMAYWDPFKNTDGANIILFFNIAGKV